MSLCCCCAWVALKTNADRGPKSLGADHAPTHPARTVFCWCLHCYRQQVGEFHAVTCALLISSTHGCAPSWVPLKPKALQVAVCAHALLQSDNPTCVCSLAPVSRSVIGLYRSRKADACFCLKKIRLWDRASPSKRLLVFHNIFEPRNSIVERGSRGCLSRASLAGGGGGHPKGQSTQCHELCPYKQTAPCWSFTMQ